MFDISNLFFINFLFRQGHVVIIYGTHYCRAYSYPHKYFPDKNNKRAFSDVFRDFYF